MKNTRRLKLLSLLLLAPMVIGLASCGANSKGSNNPGGGDIQNPDNPDNPGGDIENPDNPGGGEQVDPNAPVIKEIKPKDGHGTITITTPGGLVADEAAFIKANPDDGYGVDYVRHNGLDLHKNAEDLYAFYLNSGTNYITYKFKEVKNVGGVDLFTDPSVKKLASRGKYDGDVNDYYASCKGKVGYELKAELQRICKQGKVTLNYRGDTNKAFADADLDPDDPSKIILCYTKERYDARKFRIDGTTFNREHTWPQSIGNFKEKEEYSDVHMLRPCRETVNSLRGNLHFSDGEYGREVQGCYDNGHGFCPPKQYRGDAARSMFYMAMLYNRLEIGKPSDENRYRYFPDAQGHLNSFDDLYKWATDPSIDPVDKFEMVRNNKIDRNHQHNRNPFVDHPEFVEMIYDKNYNGPAALEEA